MASIYANLLKQKEAFTFKKRSQLPKDYFGTPTRLPFHCFGMCDQYGHCDVMWKCSIYSRTPVTQTLKGNEKQSELAGNSSYWGKFQCNFDQGKGNLVQFSREFELSEFELSRFM